MSADCVVYHGRFKDEKKRYTELKEELINGFIKLELEPDELLNSKDARLWKILFRENENYLEFYTSNCYGNWGDTLDYIENCFIKEHKDISVEFGTVEYNDGPNANGIIYDGEKISYEVPDFIEVMYEEEYYEEEYYEE